MPEVCASDRQKPELVMTATERNQTRQKSWLEAVCLLNIFLRKKNTSVTQITRRKFCFKKITREDKS